MVWTCSLPAWPVPTTAFLTIIGRYSATGSPNFAGVALLTPRAKPSFRVDPAFLLTRLASTARSPVPAANSGVVVFADDLGIYGKTVIIDHGMSLFSLYGHLSELGVQKGDVVAQGDAVGRTGTTGLAGGDHLHYAMMVSGVFVDPLEWFDDRWIQDHIEAKFKASDTNGSHP